MNKQEYKEIFNRKLEQIEEKVILNTQDLPLLNKEVFEKIKNDCEEKLSNYEIQWLHEEIDEKYKITLSTSPNCIKNTTLENPLGLSEHFKVYQAFYRFEDGFLTTVSENTYLALESLMRGEKMNEEDLTFVKRVTQDLITVLDDIDNFEQWIDEHLEILKLIKSIN